MGLDTSHDCWHGAYSSFSKWRNGLAELAGMDSPLEFSHAEGPLLDWDSYEWCNYQGMWKERPTDPLLYLIVHSDCDGYLFPDQFGPLAKRLTELLPKMSDDEWMTEKTEQFIAGLRSACYEESDMEDFDNWYGQEIVVFH